MSRLTIALVGAIIAAGAAAGGVVLLTSGPRADRVDDATPEPSAAISTASHAPSAELTSSAPRASASAARADSTLDVDEPFDPASLPAADTTGWVEYKGPGGYLTVRAPATWDVKVEEHFEYTGTVVIGDSAKITSVPHTPGAFAAPPPKPGDVWADIATERAYVPFSAGSSDEEVFHQVRFTRRIGGRDAEVVATQRKRPAGFMPGVGALTLYVSTSGPGGEYLVAAVHIALPADLTIIAEAQALLTSLVLR